MWANSLLIGIRLSLYKNELYAKIFNECFFKHFLNGGNGAIFGEW